MTAGPLRCDCEGRFLARAFAYEAPPPGETRFGLSGGAYFREVLRCGVCARFVSAHELDAGELYRADYVEATYGATGLSESFERVVGLLPERSDNYWRVRRVVEFAAGHLRGPGPPTVLDVGSGLCVFLRRLKSEDWSGTALDPDPRAVEHARAVVGVDGACGDFMELDELGRFDVVSFNKVLEHVEDPVGMLARSSRHLSAGGFVYVEVPDGEAAAALEGPEREEFFIEHLHVFSPASLALAAARAGFSPLRLDRLREPSSKLTLCAPPRARVRRKAEVTP